jgi:hypothetical protein
VAICDLPQSKGEALAAELGERALFCSTDVTSEAAVQEAVSSTHASARVSDDKETDENARARNAMFGIGEVFKFQILQAITHACYRNKPGVISGVELFDVTQEVVFK